MTDAEKIAAFEHLAIAMTNQWHDDRWTWWNPTPAGGTETPRATREEAVADLVAWAEREAKRDTARLRLNQKCQGAGAEFQRKVGTSLDAAERQQGGNDPGDGTAVGD